MTRQRFLTWLFEFCSEGKLETRGLPNTKRTFHELGNWSAVDTWCEKHSDKNLYHAVATRDGGGSKEHISQIPAVWCDLDFKDVERKEAHDRINAFPQRPSVVVETGGGYHCYWRLSEPATKEDIEQVEALNRQIAAYLGGDAASCDASRILRLPDTLNRKYDPPRKVEVIWHKSFDYNLEDLAAATPLCELSKASTKDSIYKDIKKDIYKVSNGQTPNVQNCPKLSKGVQKINFAEGHRDNSLFHVAHHCIKSGMDAINVQYLLEFLALRCDPPFPENEVRTKIQSAFKRVARQEKNLSQEIRAWVMSSSDQFLSKEIQECLVLSKRKERKLLSEVLRNLVAEGVIERAGGQNASFRRVDRECEVIDFKNACLDTIELIWPLEIETLFTPRPRNVIVIAGEMNLGKTALLLNLVKLNMNQHDIHYFSSEMGDTEFRERLELFKDISLDDWNFTPKDRTGGFQDVIVPNAVNIIDYLEMTGRKGEEFYAIAGVLSDIYQKLKKGIAIVAIQKDPGAELGLGKYRGMEKPRLYVTLSRDEHSNIATIQKLKGKWHGTQNPDGMFRRFKLFGGYRMESMTEWRK